MSTAEYDRVFVVGTDPAGNRELVHVPAGEDTDLPASAEYYYTDVIARFPYELGHV